MVRTLEGDGYSSHEKLEILRDKVGFYSSLLWTWWVSSSLACLPPPFFFFLLEGLWLFIMRNTNVTVGELHLKFSLESGLQNPPVECISLMHVYSLSATIVVVIILVLSGLATSAFQRNSQVLIVVALLIDYRLQLLCTCLQYVFVA